MKPPQITLEQLQKFCCDYREDLMSPYSIGGSTYATNGKVIIRVAKIEGVRTTGYGSLDSAALPWTHSMSTAPWLDRNVPLPEIKTRTCTDCKGNAKIERCKKCDGTGSYTCECCYSWVKCATCDKTGWIPSTSPDSDAEKCETCDGTGIEHVEQSVDMFGLMLSDYYVRMIEANLTNVEWPETQAALPHSPVMFRFDGGEGLIMPYRKSVP